MKRYWLKFSVTQTEAPLDVISVTHGGSLSNAAARHEVDFAVTGSRHSKYGVLSDHVPSEVQIEFPAGQITMTPGATDRVSVLCQCAAKPDRQSQIMGRVRRAERDRQSETSRARQAERDRHSHTDRARQAYPDRQRGTDRAGQIEPDRQRGTDRAG